MYFPFLFFLLFECIHHLCRMRGILKYEVNNMLGLPLVAHPETTTSPLNLHLSSEQASVSPRSYTLSKCFLPEESTVISVYCSAGAFLLLLFLTHCLCMKGLCSLCLLGKHKSL